MAGIDIGDIIRQISSGLKSAKYKSPTEQAQEYREEVLKSRDKDIEALRAEDIAKRMEGVKSQHALALQGATTEGMLKRVGLTQAGETERVNLVQAGERAREELRSKTAGQVAEWGFKGHERGAQAIEESARTGAESKDPYSIALKSARSPEEIQKLATMFGKGPQAGSVTPQAGPGAAARASLPGGATTPFSPQGVAVTKEPLGAESLTGMPAFGSDKKKKGKTGFAALFPDPSKYRLGF